HTLQADNLAGSLMSQWRVAAFDSMAPGAVARPDPVTIDGVDYSPMIECLAVEGLSPDQVRSLRVTVRWEFRGKAHRLVRELWVHRALQRSL
ncbi:MAG: hypothetical protein AB1758_13575, partial [Candidatus Eremiobacterota bacterium]